MLLHTVIAPAVLGITLAWSAAFGSTVIVRDNANGFTAALPSQWKDSLVASHHHIFKDTTKSCHAILGVVRYDYDTAVYKTEKAWCTSSSDAYVISVKSDPYFGYIYARDSMRQDGLFALSVNAEYGMPVRSETVRWVGRNHRGYELYAYTDTLDMYKNYATYKSILDSIHILATVGVQRHLVRQDFSARSQTMDRRTLTDISHLSKPGKGEIISIYDLAGRLVQGHFLAGKRRMTSGILIVDLRKDGH